MCFINRFVPHKKTWMLEVKRVLYKGSNRKCLSVELMIDKPDRTSFNHLVVCGLKPDNHEKKTCWYLLQVKYPQYLPVCWQLRMPVTFMLKQKITLSMILTHETEKSLVASLLFCHTCLSQSENVIISEYELWSGSHQFEFVCI